MNLRYVQVVSKTLSRSIPTTIRHLQFLNFSRITATLPSSHWRGVPNLHSHNHFAANFSASVFGWLRLQRCGVYKMSMAAYQNDHGSYLLSVPSGSTSSGAAAPRTHSAHMLGALPSATVPPMQSMPCATVLLPANAAINSNGVSLVNGDSTLVSGLLCTPHSSARNQEASVPFDQYRSNMPRAYSTPLVSMQSSHAFPFSEVEVPRSSALSLNVPLREEEAEPIIQLPTQAGNGQNELIKNAPPSTSTANSHEQDEESEPDGEIDIQIRNVVCTYTLPLHIDLHRVALNCGNVTFDRGRGVLLKQKRNPLCYVKVYSSGKIYIVGCRSEAECKRAARGVARMVQKSMGKQADVVRIRNYRICNVLATCKMPFGIKIEEMAQKYPENSDYEPELSVGLVWRSVDPKATLRIHTTGSITVTGALSEADVMKAIEVIYPILREFRCAFRLRDDGFGGAKRSQLRKRRPSRSQPLISATVAKRQRNLQSARVEEHSSGVIGNRVYFSDEEDEMLEY
uniref:TATA box-binding protein-like 1 n=2 Tax=Ascaris suum TaxID=6253 RepID=F1KWB6_ASCSU